MTVGDAVPMESAAVLDVDEEEPQEPQAPRAHGLRSRLGQVGWIYFVLAGLLIILGVSNPDKFATVDNFRFLFINASMLMIMSVGMLFVISTAGIDLSIGQVNAFSAVISIRVMQAIGLDRGAVSVLAGLVVCLGSGLAWGLLNGVLVSKAKVPPLIVTLGTLGMSLGAADLLTGGTDLPGVPPELVNTIGLGRLFGQVPYMVIIAIAVVAVAFICYKYTRFGLYTAAIGSNPEAARRAGINVDRHLIKVYGLAGLLAGLAGFLSLAYFGTTSIAGHPTDNLDAVAAVVIGGTSLFGGVGTVVGTAVGVFIPAVLQNGFIIIGVQAYWQYVAVGAVLIVAVYVDQLRRRARERQ